MPALQHDQGLLPSLKPSEASVTRRAVLGPSKSHVSLRVTGQGSSPPGCNHCPPRGSWCDKQVMVCGRLQMPEPGGSEGGEPTQALPAAGSSHMSGRRLCLAPGPTPLLFLSQKPGEARSPFSHWAVVEEPWVRLPAESTQAQSQGLASLGRQSSWTQDRPNRNACLSSNFKQDFNSKANPERRGCRKQGGSDVDAQRLAAHCSQRLLFSRARSTWAGSPSCSEALSTVQSHPGQRQRARAAGRMDERQWHRVPRGWAKLLKAPPARASRNIP